MKAYTCFAKMYENFMRDIPYDEWFTIILDFLHEYNINSGNILETGCGTGTFTRMLAKAGYDMYGIDISPEMIKQASKKCGKGCNDIIYDIQDMRALDIDKKFNAAISICDSMNYLENLFDLDSTLSCIHDVVLPGGIFIFDLKTEQYYIQLGRQTFTDTTEQGTYIWENEYCETEKNNYYYLTFFVNVGHDKYKKFNEEHLQHVFTEEEVRASAEKTHFKINKIINKNERQYFILERI